MDPYADPAGYLDKLRRDTAAMNLMSVRIEKVLSDIAALAQASA